MINVEGAYPLPATGLSPEKMPVPDELIFELLAMFH
jgi:hypothetical protein